MACVPAAFLVGVIGLFRDKSKWAAGSAAIVAGGYIAFYIRMIAVVMAS